MKRGRMRMQSKAVAIVLTLGVLVGVFTLGPIQAELMDIITSQTMVGIGEPLMLTIEFIKEPTDSFSVNQFSVDLKGPISITCLFDTDGNPISSCVGITIDKVAMDNMSFGYGYGYGYGPHGMNYTYTLSFDTSLYPPGTYESGFFALTDEGVFKHTGPEFTLLDQEVVLESCSVRARDGELSINGQSYDGMGRLNFNVPKVGAVNGGGVLIAQHQGSRAVYNFDVTNILTNNVFQTSMIISGDYRTGRNGNVGEQAVLTLYKKNQTVKINGDAIDADGMDVTFLRGCTPI